MARAVSESDDVVCRECRGSLVSYKSLSLSVFAISLSVGPSITIHLYVVFKPTVSHGFSVSECFGFLQHHSDQAQSAIRIHSYRYRLEPYSCTGLNHL